jgi:hypothetical protein
MLVLVLDEVPRMDVGPEQDEGVPGARDVPLRLWLGVRLLLRRAMDAGLGRRDVLADGRGRRQRREVRGRA